MQKTINKSKPYNNHYNVDYNLNSQNMLIRAVFSKNN